MRLQQAIGVLALGIALSSLAACHHGPRLAPVVPPNEQLARAMDLFHHGDFRRAQAILQRLTFDLEPGDPTLPQIRYYMAECSFQMGDYVQASSDFRKVSDEDGPRQPQAMDEPGDGVCAAGAAQGRRRESAAVAPPRARSGVRGDGAGDLSGAVRALPRQ